LNRRLRLALQVLVSAGVVGYLVWRIDLARTFDLIAETDVAYLLAALAIFLATTWAMAWRWQLLLAAKQIDEPLGWLTRLYFVGYAASQVLPTGIGGDAVRIFEHARRRPEAKAAAAAAVLMERVIGAAGTLVLVAVAIAIAAGRYEDIRSIVLIEGIFFVATALFLIALFSRRTGRELQKRVFPLGRRLRLERPVTSVYLAMQDYRERPAAMLAVLGVTLLTQSVRIMSIWLCGLAVGIDVSPLVYFILGPLLFIVQMVPITLNGIGVREVFFVEFLARFEVDEPAALAAGLLFFAVAMATSLPGGFILLWRSVRPVTRESPI
jgi:glycosyltransferase 2 family protein